MSDSSKDKENPKKIVIDGCEYNFHLGGRLTLATPKLLEAAFDSIEN